MPNENFISVLLKHKFFLGAIGAVVLIAIGSGIYYVEATKKPAAVSLPSVNSMQPTITAPGVVEPLENPNLSFANAGRITSVTVSVGDRVFAGQTLASLDIAALIAQRQQGEAQVKAEQAKLDELKSPPRSTDLAVRQTALSQAEQARTNTYADIPSAISDAYAKSVDAVHSQSDAVFSNANTSSPTLIFSTSNAAAGNAAVSARISAGAELSLWNNEILALSASPAEADLDQALTRAVAHLLLIREFEDSLIAALNVAIPSTYFPPSSVASAQTAVSAARGSVNSLITSLTDKKQLLVSEMLSIQAAQASLDQLNAGASSQDIAVQEAAVERAQATVAGINAQIGNNIISAPFSGVVGSVSIKAGEFATQNAPAITLTPDSALEVVVYVTELDVTRIKKGNTASITLDAFGSNRVFPAHVSQVDTAPSQVQGIPAYKVKLVFDAPDASVKTGMTANATITPSAQ